MSELVCLGWRVQQDEWDSFVSYVHEKWGRTDGYLRFELESAMREFLDKDGILTDTERLLRDYLDSRGLSSSSDPIADENRYRGDTKKIGHRVQPELKDDFAALAKQHFDRNLGAVLTRALNSYRGGGRKQRVSELVHRLVESGIGGDTTDDFDENTNSSRSRSDTTDVTDENLARTDENTDGSNGIARDTTSVSDENSGIDAMAVSDIASQLDEPFWKDDLHQAIAKRVGGDGDTIQLYTAAVTDYENVVEHPVREGMFIPKTARENITIYDDLDRDARVEKLRTFITYEALRRKKRKIGFDYREVQDIFEKELNGSPSHDYAYTLMELAGEKIGFKYAKQNGQMRLTVDLGAVQDGYIEDAEPLGIDKELVTAVTSGHYDGFEEGSDTTPNGIENPDTELTSFAAGATPEQDAAADD